jgi:ABC-type transport system substrate-binding protein
MAYPDKPLPAGLILAPELAESEPAISRNGRTYTFTIRRDARFSTGQPVSARDFAHALERILDPTMKSPYALNFQDILGARKMLAGKTATLAGVAAKGRTLTVSLTSPAGDFPARTTEVCAVPASLPADPEGAKAPLPSAAPYYVSEYVAGEQLVLDRNRFYRGGRPHHVDRIRVDLAADPATLLDQITRGNVDYAPPGPWIGGHEAELERRYGINKSRLFVLPNLETHMFVLNTSRPLFQNNSALRRAVSFAVDRHALVANEFGRFVEGPADHYLPPTMPGYLKTRIYPFHPDLRRARALAHGHTRSGRATLYTCADVVCVAPAQVVKQNLAKIGLHVVVKTFPTPVQLDKMATPREPFDIGRIWVGGSRDPGAFVSLFDSRAIPGSETYVTGQAANYSHFSSRLYNRLIARASKLSGAARYRAYGDLDLQLGSQAAPAVAYANVNELTLVSARVRCVVVNPQLDLTAICLK